MKHSIDLHMHSTHSDGTVAPDELMRLCAKKKLTHVSLTDHDTVSGFAEAKQAADENGIELIPGIEISVSFNPGAMHILGYFIDPENKALLDELEDIQRSREERNPKIIEALQELGIEITMEDVLAEATQKADASYGQIGRPHFAKALVRKKVVKSIAEAFKRYLAKGASAYVEKWRLGSKEAIALIQNAGGVASLAHPRSLRLENIELDEALMRMKEEGLGAIETFHSSHKPRERNEYQYLAEKYDLVMTGGSDYHGKNKPSVKLGDLGSGAKFEEDVLERLKEKAWS